MYLLNFIFIGKHVNKTRVFIAGRCGVYFYLLMIKFARDELKVSNLLNNSSWKWEWDLSEFSDIFVKKSFVGKQGVDQSTYDICAA